MKMASKRLKKQRECPNPLFLKWLEDWRDEAKQRNSKLQYTYGKAAAALRKYPLPLSCGKDAMILDNIGDMIARRLDKAFEEYNAHNQEVLESASIQEDYNNKGEMDPTGLSLNVPSPPLLGVDIDFGRKTTTKKKPVRRKSTREYIPAYRSGPFALLLTLYRQSQKPNYRGYMTRAELQKEAQPLCDASFTMPDPGSHYTAWSSMSTLTKKGLILKTNNPARYTLTDAGCLLVAKLENVTRSDSLTSTSNTSNPRLSGPSPPGCSEKNFTFSSVSPTTWENNKPEWDICVDIAKLSDPHKQEIHVQRSANFTKVKEREKNNVEPKRIIEEDSVCASPEFVLRPGTFDILLCVDVNETSTGQAKSRKEGLAPELKKNGVQFDVRKLQLGDFLWVARERTFPTPGCLSVPVARELVLDHIVERKRMDDLCGSIIDGRFREQKKFRAELEEKDTEVRQKACYFRTNASMPNMMSSERTVFFRVAFTPDISQFPFPRHPESEKFFGFLMKHVMATAQIRVGFSDTRRSLNCVAKFRLLHCGLKHPIYLVEDFGSIQHMSLPESTLQQAIVNTQVVDGFFVKRTHDLKESVAYLTVMTRYLQRIYSNKTLVSCSQRRLEEANSSTSRQTDKKYLMSFPDFNDSTVKNKVMTVREVFAKQLMQISGMSPDKAVAILDRYPTPKSLLDAYSLLSSVKDKELLLSALKCGKNQRNLGPTLSRLIYILYSSPTLS